MAYLQRVVPARNMHRFYRITLAPTLFGDWALIREWGRIGSPVGQRMEQWFATESEALGALNSLIATKRQRGYAS
jgi:predicted DNA-binding WGR domain protein